MVTEKEVSRMKKLKHPIPALHTVQVLDRAYSRTL
jgi:hypothetical protein